MRERTDSGGAGWMRRMGVRDVRREVGRRIFLREATCPTSKYLHGDSSECVFTEDVRARDFFLFFLLMKPDLSENCN